MKRFLLAGLVLAAACDQGREPSSDELTIVVKGDRRELEQQERSLREREDALRAEKAALEKRIADLSTNLKAAADSQQRLRLEEELRREQDLAEQMNAKVAAVSQEKSAVAAKKQVTEADSVATAALALREARVTARESDVTLREKDVAAREKALEQLAQQIAQTQAQLAAQLKAQPGQEKLQAAARELPRSQALDQKHRQLLADLGERGILISDFPPEDQPLNAEVWAARRQGDVTRAWDLLADLQKALARLKVDQRFVEQKMVRLQGARSGAKLSADQRGEVERLLREVTSAYSDGKYEQANKGLNRIASILDAGAAPG